MALVSTTARIHERAAELVAPIADRLLELAWVDPYLSADETRMPVQQEGGCAVCRDCGFTKCR